MFHSLLTNVCTVLTILLTTHLCSPLPLFTYISPTSHSHLTHSSLTPHLYLTHTSLTPHSLFTPHSHLTHSSLTPHTLLTHTSHTSPQPSHMYRITNSLSHTCYTPLFTLTLFDRKSLQSTSYKHTNNTPTGFSNCFLKDFQQLVPLNCSQ